MRQSQPEARQTSPSHLQLPEAEQITEDLPYRQEARHQQNLHTTEAAVRAPRAEGLSADSPQRPEIPTHMKEVRLHTKEVLRILHVHQATAAAVAEDTAGAALEAVAAIAAAEHPEAAVQLEEEDNKPLRLIYNEKDSNYISADVRSPCIVCPDSI